MQEFRNHLQRLLLTGSIQPFLHQLHHDGKYYIGQNFKIYWRLTVPPDKGAALVDWFYVPNVAPTLSGQERHAYLLWKECVAPLVVLEFVSEDKTYTEDKTPWTGKFWIHEQVIRPAFYAVYQLKPASITLYVLKEGTYQISPANEQGRYPISPMGIELGIWRGKYKAAPVPWVRYVTLPWLRWWDQDGNMLFTNEERAEKGELSLEQGNQLAELEQWKTHQGYWHAEEQRHRAEGLAAKLRAKGIEPEL